MYRSSSKIEHNIGSFSVCYGLELVKKIQAYNGIASEALLVDNRVKFWLNWAW